MRTEDFHWDYYNSGVWNHTFWRGIPALKCPLDLWIYQEIVCDVRPTLIVELGTHFGGTTLFLADVVELIRTDTQIITVDLVPALKESHPRIECVAGSSIAPETVARIAEAAKLSAGAVMVIADSDHRMAHVAEELRLYSPFVTLGSFFIVEDTNINGHPVLPGYGPGPAEAVDQFLSTNTEFSPDPIAEKFGMTFNPGGYLKRVKSAEPRLPA